MHSKVEVIRLIKEAPERRLRSWPIKVFVSSSHLRKVPIVWYTTGMYCIIAKQYLQNY